MPEMPIFLPCPSKPVLGNLQGLPRGVCTMNGLEEKLLEYEQWAMIKGDEPYKNKVLRSIAKQFKRSRRVAK